jgi:hypothetical protein
MHAPSEQTIECLWRAQGDCIRRFVAEVDEEQVRGQLPWPLAWHSQTNRPGLAGEALAGSQGARGRAMLFARWPLVSLFAALARLCSCSTYASIMIVRIQPCASENLASNCVLTVLTVKNRLCYSPCEGVQAVCGTAANLGDERTKVTACYFDQANQETTAPCIVPWLL